VLVEYENESAADEIPSANDGDPSVTTKCESAIDCGESTANDCMSADGKSKEVTNRNQSPECFVQSAAYDSRAAATSSRVHHVRGEADGCGMFRVTSRNAR
jgi:hypothetical protein